MGDIDEYMDQKRKEFDHWHNFIIVYYIRTRQDQTGPENTPPAIC